MELLIHLQLLSNSVIKNAIQCRKDIFVNFKHIYSLLFLKQIIYLNKFLHSFAGFYDYLLTIISELHKHVDYQQVHLVFKSTNKWGQ